jgi:hypothetical protein
MSKPKVIVTRRWPEAVETRLAEVFDVELNGSDRPMSQDQLRAAFAQADAVFPTVSDRIGAEVLGAEPQGGEPFRAKLCGNFGVGFNNIDIEAAKARGIAVTNTPGVLTDATADLAMTLLLAVARRAGEGERHLRNGEWTGWRPTHMMGTQVTGKTLGLIGFGRIGRALAERAHFGFNMDVLLRVPDQHLARRRDRRGGAGRSPPVGRHRRRRAGRLRGRAPGGARAPGDGERGPAAAPGQRHHRDPGRHGHESGGERRSVLRRRGTAESGGVNQYACWSATVSLPSPPKRVAK